MAPNSPGPEAATKPAVPLITGVCASRRLKTASPQQQRKKVESRRRRWGPSPAFQREAAQPSATSPKGGLIDAAAKQSAPQSAGRRASHAQSAKERAQAIDGSVKNDFE